MCVLLMVSAGDVRETAAGPVLDAIRAGDRSRGQGLVFEAELDHLRKRLHVCNTGMDTT